MECEVQKGGGDGSEAASAPLVSILEEQVKIATDKLLLTNFPACLEICRHVTAAANSCENTDPDTVERLAKVREAATVIGIQALAESGTWREVIPFVEQVYTRMATCPAAIMQMCLLLHAQVREYLVCHSLVNSWLDWNDHRNHPDSGTIVGIYITNVLIPLGAFNLIPQVVERCAVLSSIERQNLLSPRVGSSPRGHGHFKSMSDGSDATDDGNSLMSDEQHSVDEDNQDKPRAFEIVSLYVSIAGRLWRNFSKKGWCQQFLRASKLFLLISFVLFALMHVQTDVTASFSRAMEVWKTAFRALYSVWKRGPLKHT